MSKLKVIIVDDELNARENLRYLLKVFCKEVEVVSEASNVDDAVEEIKKHEPQVVFLDIEMPRKNGFQLLDSFDIINFQIIFVTAYDMYAIKAFEVAALDYLLKPIDIERLKEAVVKAEKTIDISAKNERLDILKENKKNLNKIAIPYKSDYIILDINDVFCIEADRMYSIIHTKKDKKYVSAKKLSYYENLLCKDDQFIRLHRSWMVNASLIHMYSKKEKMVELENTFKIPLSKTYKENFESLFYT